MVVTDVVQVEPDKILEEGQWSRWLEYAPEHTKAYAVEWTHTIRDGEECNHTECALVYLDRCIILTTDNMIMLHSGATDTETIMQRLSAPVLPVA